MLLLLLTYAEATFAANANDYRNVSNEIVDASSKYLFYSMFKPVTLLKFKNVLPLLCFPVLNFSGIFSISNQRLCI